MENLNSTFLVFLSLAVLMIHNSCSSCSASGRKKQRFKYQTEQKRFSKSNRSQKERRHKAELKATKTCGLQEGIFYRVQKEVDGDTFWLDDGCEGVKIRLIGIDAPESRNAFNHVRKEPFGKEATRYMSYLLGDSKVRVEFDVDSLDQYNRTLAYCFTESGVFLNKQMVENGLAMIQTVQPNVKYKDEFYKAQLGARKNKLNLWKDTN